MRLDLKGKHALVCGASQGIGLAAAKELAELGAQCTLMARNRERLEAAAKEHCPGTGHGIAVADFTDPDAVSEAAKKRGEQRPGGHPHQQYRRPSGRSGSCSGYPGLPRGLHPTPHVQPTAGPGGVARHEAAGGGRIVNVISTSVKQPLDGLGVSNTVRGAVANWAKDAGQ